MNPRLIRLMASQYRELQGLATMADGMIPIAIAGFVAVAHSGWDLLLAVPDAHRLPALPQPRALS